MISWIVNHLKASLTGRVEPMARLDLSKLLAKNATVQQNRYAWYFRPVLWGADHPVLFAFAMAAGALLAAEAFATWKVGAFLGMPELAIQSDFDAAAYLGVPWAVQATFVALVYPIVLSFVALLFQRKNHTAVAMRVYLLESAVVPAGASAVGLLIAMSIQYLLIPYSRIDSLRHWMPELLMANGIWFVANLWLAGMFVSRTVRFLDAKERAAGYTRVAVDIVLRREQTDAVKRRLYRQMSYNDWSFPFSESDQRLGPLVELAFGGRSNQLEVTKTVSPSSELFDVRTKLLKLAIISWSGRVGSTKAQRGKRARISFPQQIGTKASGRLTLCEVENGPPLNKVEKLLVRYAFVYRRVPRQALTSNDVLKELAAEVEGQAEREQYGAAYEALTTLIELHRTFLKAGAIEHKGVPANVALEESSPYGYRSYVKEWSDHYWDIARLAVKGIAHNNRLLSGMAHAPMRIGRGLPPKLQTIHAELVKVNQHASSELSAWWQRQAESHRSDGNVAFSGVLPAPLGKVYENALIALIGADFRFSGSLPRDASSEEVWAKKCSDSLVLAARIDERAFEILRAVDLGDVAAAQWFTDSFLKWKETRAPKKLLVDRNNVILHELTLDLAKRDWKSAQDYLWQGGAPVPVEQATVYLDAAVHNYWLGVRIVLAVTLVHEAGAEAGADNLALLMAAAILKSAPIKPGGSPAGHSLNDFDGIFRVVLRNLYGRSAESARLDQLGERRRRASDEPIVPGWVYMFSGSVAQFSSMREALARLLIAVSNARSTRLPPICARQVQNLWQDLGELEQVKTYCLDMHKKVLAAHFHGDGCAIEALSQLLGHQEPAVSRVFGASALLKRLASLADYERLITLRSRPVEVDLIKGWAQEVSVGVMSDLAVSLLPGTVIQVSTSREGAPVAVPFAMKKAWFTKDATNYDRISMADSVVGGLREALILSATEDLLIGLKPANSAAMHDDVVRESGLAEDFLRTLAQSIKVVRDAGGTPVILAGDLGWHLNPGKWGDAHYQYRPVPGVSIRGGEARQGEMSIASFVEEVPVYEHATPNGDCYVVDFELMRQLHIGGEDTAAVARSTWHQIGDEKLVVRLEWSVRFGC